MLPEGDPTDDDEEIDGEEVNTTTLLVGDTRTLDELEVTLLLGVEDGTPAELVKTVVIGVDDKTLEEVAIDEDATTTLLAVTEDNSLVRTDEDEVCAKELLVRELVEYVGVGV